MREGSRIEEEEEESGYGERRQQSNSRKRQRAYVDFPFDLLFQSPSSCGFPQFLRLLVYLQIAQVLNRSLQDNLTLVRDALIRRLVLLRLKALTQVFSLPCFFNCLTLFRLLKMLTHGF